MSFTAAFDFSIFRQARMICEAPRQIIDQHASSPRPELAPVTMTVLPLKDAVEEGGS
jgi:hypothetical protein